MKFEIYNDCLSLIYTARLFICGNNSRNNWDVRTILWELQWDMWNLIPTITIRDKLYLIYNYIITDW